MAFTVYLLCSISSAVCAILLLRTYRDSRARFLLFGTIAFTGIAIANALLLVDLGVLPNVDLFVYRQLVTLVSVIALIWGFVWETK